MIFSMPLISTYPIPQQVKIWLGALVAFLLFPMVAANHSFIVPHSMPEVLVYLIREFSIGFLIGFCANFLFAAVQIGGEFVSIQTGLSMSQVLDPATGEATQILSQMYSYLATMVFIGLNAHQWLFAAIYKSFQAFPPGIEYFFTGDIISQVLHMSSDVFYRHKYDFAHILCYVCIRSSYGLYVKNDATDEHLYGCNTVKNICWYRFDVDVFITDSYISCYCDTKLP